jgi:hypothetical protein
MPQKTFPLARLVSLSIWTSALICSSPSAADFTMTIAPDFAMVAMMRQVRDTNQTATGAIGTPQISVDASRPTAAPPMAYKASASRRRANLATFIEKSRKGDPLGAEKMVALFASTDVIAMIDQRMRQVYGMRSDNVADAYAIWWTSAWMGSKGRSDDVTPGQMAMVKRQAANALAATPEFAAATDATKQEMAEAVLIQAAMIGDAIDTYKTDPAMFAKTKAAIAKGAKGMGLDLDSMTLSDQGFLLVE